MKVTQIVHLMANALVLEKRAAVPVAKPAPALAGRRMLIVDDEPDVRAFLTAVLEDNGAVVFAAADGDEGLALARREKPDLVTLDLSMPGRDGGKVYEAMRRDEELKFVRVCIITGKPELRKLIYERPVPPPEGYLDKPVNEETLLTNVRKILEAGAEHKAH
jgi:CheY-like chemotaxis protein